MPGWIGRDLERLRKRRGLRREDVAAQLSLSPSTIRNIEHDERYNISLDVLRQIAEVLGATVHVTIQEHGDGVGSDAAAEGNQMAEGRRVVTNDYFITLIRERYPDCPLTNSQIGRRMWQFAMSRGAEMVQGRRQVKRSAGVTVSGRPMPTVVASYSVRERDMAALEQFADRLGLAFKDGKGRVLVPIR
jgi:transcriptional regulator with XRE-family HTH domain